MLFASLTLDRAPIPFASFPCAPYPTNLVILTIRVKSGLDLTRTRRVRNKRRKRRKETRTIRRKRSTRTRLATIGYVSGTYVLASCSHMAIELRSIYFISGSSRTAEKTAIPQYSSHAGVLCWRVGLVPIAYSDLCYCGRFRRNGSYAGAVRPEPAVCKKLDRHLDGHTRGTLYMILLTDPR